MQMVIGGAEHERLVVDVRGYSNPHATDIYDGNWLTARVSIDVGGFCGAFDCELRTEDFIALARDAADLHDDLRGVATFKTIEGQLEFRVAGDGLGHFEVAGEVIDRVGDGNRLAWTIHIDQTQLPEISARAASIVRTYPKRRR